MQVTADTDVIQIRDLEEIKEFNMDTAKPFINKNVIIGPYSFADSRDKKDVNNPAPMYFGQNIIMQPLTVDKDEILKGFILKPDGVLVCTDKV